MIAPASGQTVLHASAVAIGETGVLIRGASGAGKSTLARELIQLGSLAGMPASLVGDDRVEVAAEAGRLSARPVAAIAGLLEVRGLGIARVPFRPEAAIGLVVDIEAGLSARYPAAADRIADILSVEISRIVVNGPGAALLVLWRLGVGDDVFMTDA